MAGMTGWRLFKRKPEPRQVIDEDAELIRLLAKLPPQPSPVRRSTASIRSHRSSRSSRSSKSAGPSSRSTRSLSRSSRGSNRRRPHRVSGPIAVDRRCYVCARYFQGFQCAQCDTNYDFEPLEASALDFSLLFDLASTNDSELMESLITDTFSSLSATIETFAVDPTDLSRPNPLDTDKIALFYEICATPTSTSPMRAVLQGAQTVLLQRKFRPLDRNELLYILIVLRSPTFTQCSMFTKITGPLQKLARYSSLRSRARVILEISMGLMAHMCSDLRDFTVEHLAEMDIEQFRKTVDLINSYVGHRLMFHFHYKSSHPQQSKNVSAKNEIKVHWYADDWRIAAAAKLLAIFFDSSNLVNRLPVSHFYNMVVDHIELGTDYDAWHATQKRRAGSGASTFSDFWSMDPALLNRFSFCEYPFLLSITSKSIVFKHSLQRKVRDHQLHGSFSSFSRGRSNSVGSGASSLYSVQPGRATDASNSAVHAAWSAASQPHNKRLTLSLRIRRERLFEDSVSLLLSHSANDVKKPLRIEFEGEPGIDAGGLCKEWIHLLFTQLTAPELALFTQEEDSAYNWFNSSNTQLDYYTVAGVALGIAFNNGMMLDSGLPDLAYKVLLDTPFSIADVQEVWPTVTQSLSSILQYEGDDLEDVFGLYWLAPDGAPLCKDGDSIPVTSHNREKYVEECVKYMTRVTDQLYCFKQGFIHTCDTPALGMFTATEVEALLRGERKPIDILALKNNTRYLHWGTAQDIAREPVLIWFWEFFSSLSPDKQALLLVFITATPRVPATGISTMQFRISCLGPDSDRLPIAHTCFNQLGLYRYRSRCKLYSKLTLAMTECQSFGIK